MPDTFFKELNKITRARKIVSYLPERLKFRTLKTLYNYESDSIYGIDLVAPLQDDGLVCFINTKDVIGWKILFYKEYEADTNIILKKYVKKGDVVIEAGANLGSETILLSRMVGDNGAVYGFEPNPNVFERLGINMAINELNNVKIFKVAIGESDKTIHFNIYPKGFCNPGMSSKYQETNLTQKIEVTQKTIDTIVAENNIARVDFIKMDIQGAEVDLLNGAKKTIARHKPTIFAEAFRIWTNIDEMYSILTAMGYKVSLISVDTTVPITSPANLPEGNWLATA